jgi:ADP-ribose pyrophosphatase
MSEPDQVVYEGKFIRVVRRDKWEYVSRRNISGIVGIIALTDDGKLLLVEQFRPPIGKNVIEIPAGLAGDVAGSEHEELTAAAQRELLEETGYEASELHEVISGASSAGVCDEIITLFVARGVTRTHEQAHGDGSEKITLREIPLEEVQTWIRQRVREGAAVDLKVYAALFFAQQEISRRNLKSSDS